MSKAVSGFRWVAVDKFGQQIFTFIIFLVIASRLEPSEFGIYAFCMIIVSTAQLLQDLGIGETIIKLPKRQDILDTAFITNVAISLVITLIIFFGADIFSAWYGMPEAGHFVKLISVSVLIKSLIIVQDSILKKYLNYRLLTIRTAIAKVISSLVAVTLVFLDYGVYALVYQHILFSLLSVMLIWFIADWRPKFQFNLTTLKRVLWFSTSFFKSKILSVISTKSDEFIIGYFFGPTILGLYTVAYNFVSRIQLLLNGIILSYAYPLMSSKARKQVEKLYFTILQHLSFLSLLIFVNLFIYDNQVINILLGDKWQEADFFIQILSVYALAKVISGLTSQTLKAINKLNLLVNIKLVETVMKVVLLIALSYLLSAYTVILISYIIVSLYMIVVYTHYLFKGLKKNISSIFSAYGKSVTYSLPLFIGLLYKPESDILAILYASLIAILCCATYVYKNQEIQSIVKNVLKL